MSNEQNLDHMLKLLRESVDSLGDGESADETGAQASSLSTAELQRQLEERYFSQGEKGTHEADGSYELDSSFLAEFSEVSEEVDEVSASDEDDRAPWDEPVVALENAEDTDEDETVEDTDDTEFDGAYEPDTYEGKDDGELDRFEELAELYEQETGDSQMEAPSFEIDTDAYSSPVATLERDDTESGDELYDLFEDSVAEENDVIDMQNDLELDECEVPKAPDEPDGFEVDGGLDKVDNSDGLCEDTYDMPSELVADGGEELFDGCEKEPVYDEVEAESTLDEVDTGCVSEEDTSETVSDRPVFNEYSSYPKERPISFKALMMDYGRPDPIPTSSATAEEAAEPELEQTPDVGDILSDFADIAPTSEDKMNTSMRKLMTSLGCEDELERVSPEDIGTIYGQLEDVASEDDASVWARAVEEKRSYYKKGIAFSSLKLVACAVMTFIMLLYDMLPVLEVEFSGLVDYELYPVAYSLIGSQLLLICAVCLWRPMWGGIKRLFTVYPNIYSMAVVMVASCLFYDGVLLIGSSYEPLTTPTFHFLCGAVLTGIALYGLLMRVREAGAFDIYSADMAKFTLTYDKSHHSIGEKMYSGGYSKDRRVYLPSPVTSPKGFSESIADDGELGGRGTPWLIIGSVGVGVLLGIALMIAGRSLAEGAAAATSAVMALLPVSAVAAAVLPLSISGARLKRRGIALTGREKIRRYGEKHALVFNDLHLFKKCDPKQVGFVCYEPLQTKGVLSALNALFSRIGGPMGEVFANIPNECKAKSIRVRRITRSGIEAVIDKSHTLVVGDIEFLRRYGIEFPRNDTHTGTDRNATLYVSLDSRATAKLTTRYVVEPLFDMLIERLSEEGIHCVIETYDPMINTAFAAKQRKKGRAPISVVHKNAADINRAVSNAKKRSDHGILALSSRLKLAEAVVFCSRLCKIEKISNAVVYASTALCFLLVLLLAIFAAVPSVMQLLLLLYVLLVCVVLLFVTLALLPAKSYFTVAAIENEDRQREEKTNEKHSRDKKERKDK